MGIAAAHTRRARQCGGGFCHRFGNRRVTRPTQLRTAGAGLADHAQHQAKCAAKHGKQQTQHQARGHAQRRRSRGQDCRQVEMAHQTGQRIGASGQTAQTEQSSKP